MLRHICCLTMLAVCAAVRKWRLFVVFILLLAVYFVTVFLPTQSVVSWTNLPAPSPEVRKGAKQSSYNSGSQSYFGRAQKKSLDIASAGESIKVGETTEVHVMSAIRRSNFPETGINSIVLNTWTGSRQTDKINFVCCLTHSPIVSRDIVLQTPAHKLNKNGTSDMNFGLFGCHLNNDSRDVTNSIKNTGSWPYLQYVAFAENTCDVNMTRTAHKVVDPPDGRNQVAVCVGFACGSSFRPEKLVEWFEFARITGVSVVQLFYDSDISEEAMKVFKYYQKTRFLILAPARPAIRVGHRQRGYDINKNSPALQIWQDKQVLLNDCLHRLCNYDFVAVQDFDELLLPSPPFNTLIEVLKDARAKYPKAGAFLVDSYMVMLDWPETDNSTSISFLRRLNRSVSDMVDNKGDNISSPKIIFRPQLVVAVQTHSVTSFKKGYTSKRLPKGTHKFFHYRACKRHKWKNCTLVNTRDTEIVRFKPKWLQAISKLPLPEVACSDQYATNITTEAKNIKLNY